MTREGTSFKMSAIRHRDFVHCSMHHKGLIAQVLLIILVLLKERCVLSAADTFSKDAVDVRPRNEIPEWQSVVSDSDHPALALFGPNGPSWQLDSTDGTYENLTASVPGDLISDLMNSGLVDNPYVDRNFLTQQDIWMGHDERKTASGPNQERSLRQRTRTWVYSTSWIEDVEVYYGVQLMLVVESIKMGASVSINGVLLGNATDQFLRYTWILSEEHLSKGKMIETRNKGQRLLHRLHKLSISFEPSIGVDGRFTACSGGWDWAPYSQAGDTQGRHVFTFGIAKPIYIVPFHHLVISRVVPKIYYLGPHPRSPMLDGPLADFSVLLEVHLEYHSFESLKSGSRVAQKRNLGQIPRLLVRSDFSKTRYHELNTSAISNSTSKVQFNLTASKEDVSLWWPNGLGEQPLYDIFIGIEDANSSTSWEIRKRVGFRTAALITTNDTDDSVVAEIINSEAEGSGQHGMFFRINGAVLLARGANFIPMDQLEGRLSDESHRLAVQSAAAANMNMFRIWGGGMILSDAFYDACDENGILLYHDMMFAQHGHSPVQTDTVGRELRHIVLSLAPHPSIVLWNGCNECPVVMGTDTEIYATFVMQTVASADDTRIVWPSSPSKLGWKTGVSTLDGRPNGRHLETWDPKDFRSSLEVHGPYLRSFSTSYPTVNGREADIKYDTLPPKLDQAVIGPQFPNTFASEFGASVMSSFESMSGTLSEESWSLHGDSTPDSCEFGYNENICSGNNTMAERNYPCDSLIIGHFGNAYSLDLIGETSFKAQLYLCMISQSLWVKGQIEKLRSRNSFGLLIWQMNENWPTGGWGAIEYGTKGPGQVVGGRWKPLMHLLESSLYRDIFATCGQDDNCFVRNDGIHPVNITVHLEAWDLLESQPGDFYSQRLYLPGGSIERFSMPPDWQSIYDTVLISIEGDRNLLVMEDSIFLWKMPASIAGLLHPVTISIDSVQQGANGTAVVALSTSGLALYVVLTTRAQGRFCENAFVLKPNISREVTFVSLSSSKAVDIEDLQQSIRVEHLGMYLTSSQTAIT